MDIVETIVGIGVAFFIIAFLIPVAFEQFFLVNTDNWSSGVTSVWNALPIIGIVAIIMALLLAFIIKKLT